MARDMLRHRGMDLRLLLGILTLLQRGDLVFLEGPPDWLGHHSKPYSDGSGQFGPSDDDSLFHMRTNSEQ